MEPKPNERQVVDLLGSVMLSVVGAVFFAKGFRAISIVTEEGGKCFVLVDAPADAAAFGDAIDEAVARIKEQVHAHVAN